MTYLLQKHTPPPCMGGWCEMRDKCRHFHQQDDRIPAERLCSKGRHEAFAPIRQDWHSIVQEAA